MRLPSTVVVACLAASIGAVAAALLTSAPEPSRAFLSVIDPADYPMSPHAWPENTPIIIECWGSAADRDRARALVRAQRIGDEAFDAFFLRSDFEEWKREQLSSRMMAASTLLDSWERQGVPHPLSAITLLTANGSRYRWVNDEDPLFPARASVPQAGNVHQMFPPVSPFPSSDRVVAAQADLDQAQGVVETVQRVIARDGAMVAMLTEQELRREQEALRNAVREDALAACAHELLVR